MGKPNLDPVVEAFVFRSDWDHERDGTICHIVKREEPDPLVCFGEFHPTFRVMFTSDEEEEVVLGDSLRPWYGAP
jgi:hypothetical protein